MISKEVVLSNDYRFAFPNLWNLLMLVFILSLYLLNWRLFDFEKLFACFLSARRHAIVSSQQILLLGKLKLTLLIRNELWVVINLLLALLLVQSSQWFPRVELIQPITVRVIKHVIDRWRLTAALNILVIYAAFPSFYLYSQSVLWIGIGVICNVHDLLPSKT